MIGNDSIARYEFKYPAHEYENNSATKSHMYETTLKEIYSKCQHIWKHDDVASKDCYDLSQEIGVLISRTGMNK